MLYVYGCFGEINYDDDDREQGMLFANPQYAFRPSDPKPISDADKSAGR